MKTIDWDKAPEGATHRGSFKWFKRDGERVYAFFEGAWLRVYWAQWQLASLNKRPVTQDDAWSGEGLPPVGVACEFSHALSKQGVGYVKFYGDEFCVIQNTTKGEEREQNGRIRDYVFRPISTPEQIAADEREAAIVELKQHLCKDSAGIAAGIFDTMARLGYRKP